MPMNAGPNIYTKGYHLLGLLAAIGLLGYGLAYIIVMPEVRPDGFVPTTANSSAAPWFGALQAAFILLYAFALLPVTVLFTVKRYADNPPALILAACLMGVSLLLEISNNLPALAAGLYPGPLAPIPAQVHLYLRQQEVLRYLAFDVSGFSLAYAAIFVYALVYFRTHRWLAYTIFASIGLFIANVPCLWFAPHAAVTLMVLSIFAFAAVPVFLARQAVR